VIERISPIDDSVYRELFPHVGLDPERQRINDWRLANGGGFRSVGTGAGITGHGAHLELIDDPHKEGETDSLVTLGQVYDWYASAARTRLAPGGAVVICMTRWHPRDLVGMVLRAANSNPMADQWHVLTLPGLAEEDDQLGRGPGEALWPEWFTRDDLLSVKALSDRHFEALYQQNPRATTAQMFFKPDFQRFDLGEVANRPGAFCFDLALGEKQGGDYSTYARAHYERGSGRMWFSTLFRDRVQWPTMKAEIKRLMGLFPHDDFVFPKQAYELMAVQALRAEVPEMARKIKQVSFPGGSDKVSRAQVLADRARAGKVFIHGRLAALWVQELGRGGAASGAGESAAELGTGKNWRIGC